MLRGRGARKLYGNFEWSSVDTLSADCDLQDPLQAMCRRCSGRALKESNSGPIAFDRHCHAISPRLMTCLGVGGVRFRADNPILQESELIYCRWQYHVRRMPRSGVAWHRFRWSSIELHAPHIVSSRVQGSKPSKFVFR